MTRLIVAYKIVKTTLTAPDKAAITRAIKAGDDNRRGCVSCWP